jgi:hypothetical protein
LILLTNWPAHLPLRATPSLDVDEFHFDVLKTNDLNKYLRNCEV